MAAPCVQARRVLAFEARGRAARDCELSGPLIASLIRLIALDDPRGRAGASRPSLITTDDVPCMQVLTTAPRPSPQVRREQALAAQRAEHARHGADLQRAAWSQRALAQQERQRVTKLNQLRARGVKREAAARKADKRLRDARWMGHVEALHDEVSEIAI